VLNLNTFLKNNDVITLKLKWERDFRDPGPVTEDFLVTLPWPGRNCVVFIGKVRHFLTLVVKWPLKKRDD